MGINHASASWRSTVLRVFGLAITLVVFLGIGTASADEVRLYQASIFPNTGGTGATARMCDGATPQSLTLTYTNSQDSTHPTGSVGYTVSSELTIVSVGAADAGGKVWTVTQSGNVLTLVAASPSDKLNAGESVSVQITVTYPESAPTPRSLGIGVIASQSSDPGAGNQFSGNQLFVDVLECDNVASAACAGGNASVTTTGSGFTSTSSAANCQNGQVLLAGSLPVKGSCAGVAADVEILVNPPDPGATVTVTTDVAKSLIGGNLSAIRVCKNGVDVTSSATIVNAGINVRVSITFTGNDPIKGLT